ncbi:MULTISPECIES: hypothetical protein [Streptomyces]|uniref:hypothetical protein n=1 Tax=Streptomyces TaxID=1883 RepID=UPI003CC7A2DF
MRAVGPGRWTGPGSRSSPTGSQHCVVEGGQAAGDRERMRAGLEKLFLFLA